MKWPRVKLDTLKADVRYAFVGRPFGSNLTTRDYRDEGVPVIRGNNLPTHTAFHDDDFAFVSAEKAEDLSSNIARPGDVIFTQRGTLGQVGVIPWNAKFPEYVISQSQMKLTVDPSKTEAKFVYYFFRSPETVQNVVNRSITSGVPHINLGILKNFDVPKPPLDVQERIVETLSIYDCLIENNRRRMQLLEQSGHLLYQEWFVRFRFPGHDRVNVSDGVPRGWKRDKIGTVSPFHYGKALKAEARTAGPYPVYGSSGVVGTHEKPLVKDPAIVVGRKGNVGSVFWCPSGFWPIDTVYFVSPEQSSLFVYYTLKQVQFISTDVAVPGLNRDLAHSRVVIVPSGRLVDAFHEVVDPLHSQISTLEAQNMKLAQARDLLLPRLMNGEIAV